MKKYLFITMVMLFSISSISYANTPCCNRKMYNCTKCAKSCTKPVCMDYCSKDCKTKGHCIGTCK
jgi:hypothetical protein